MEAKKTESGRWRARGFDKYTGKTKSFTADTKKEAERLARQWQYACKPVGNEMTFGEAYDLYIQAHPNWSPSTIKDYKSWKNSRYKEFLDVPLKDMTDELLQVWIDTRITEMSAKSVTNIFVPISACLRRYRPHVAICVTMPKKDRPKLNLPSEEDVQRLLQLVEDDDYLCVPVYLAVFGAMRRGEVASLDMEHIDLRQRKIHIEFNMAKGEDMAWHYKCPKNGDERTIQVPQLVIDKIKEKGLPTISNPDDFSTYFVRFKRKHDLPDYRFHDLRHYCAARMLALGIPISVVQEYGGWKNKSVLLDIYDYVIKEVRDQSMDLWDQHSSLLAKNLPMIS